MAKDVTSEVMDWAEDWSIEVGLPAEGAPTGLGIVLHLESSCYDDNWGVDVVWRIVKVVGEAQLLEGQTRGRSR